MERVSVQERLVARLKGQVAAFSQSGKMLDEIRGIKEQNAMEINMLKSQHEELMRGLNDIKQGYETRIEHLENELLKIKEEVKQ